ncbi:MAG: hypothetical protein ACRERZ_00740 [Gammaproteobacteria bacterium]
MLGAKMPLVKNRPPVGRRYCYCSACGEYFGGVVGFDLHRLGEYTQRYCINPATAGLTKDSRGYWRRDTPDKSKFHVALPNTDDFSRNQSSSKGVP